jgi:ABC-2 type transport system permease protein
MVNYNSRKLADLLYLANGLVLFVLINLLASQFYYRFDLTEEKRYSIKTATKQLLEELDDVVYIEVFLEGEMNPAFKRFQKNIRETLDEFRVYSGNKVQYTFTDPSTALSQKARAEYMNELAQRGIQPTNVVDEKDGKRTERLLFPGALVSYAGNETGVNLFKGSRSVSKQETINQAIENIEYELANAIYKLSNTERKRIGWLQGHGELSGLGMADIVSELQEIYAFDFVRTSDAQLLDQFDVLMLAKPTQAFSASDKYVLDQYLMRGGKLLFMIDQFHVNIDSASAEFYFPTTNEHKLDDMLFRYGIRINRDLVQDRVSSKYPVVTGMAGNAPQMQMLDWYFFPLINNYAEHPITRNLDAVQLRFASSMDTVKADGVKKTPLMFSSPYVRTLSSPVNVSANELRNTQLKEMSKPLSLAFLLEGSFSSIYKNRFLPEEIVDKQNFVSESVPTKILVVSDGSLARNEINARTNQAQELGRDPFSGLMYANKDFILNALAYLSEEEGLITTRNKEVKIRPLDRQRMATEKTKWQLLNLFAPVLLIIIFGGLRSAWRKKKYAKK